MQLKQRRGDLFIKKGIASLLFLLIAVAAFSQAISIKRFNKDNGLPEGYIYTINQDQQGFLWLGTGAGTYRFDGQDFVHIPTTDTLTRSFPAASLKDSLGQIWLGHFEGGVSFLQNGEYNTIVPDSLLKSPVVGISNGTGGAIWVATQRKGLIRIDQEHKFELFDQNLESSTIFSFAVHGNRLFLGTDMGLFLFQYKNGKLVLEKKANGIPETEIQCLLQRKSQEGSFWVGTREEGLFEYFPTENSALQFANDSLGGIEFVRSIWEESDSKVWIGTNGSGFKLFSDSDPAARMQPLSGMLPQDTVSDDIVRCIFQDKFGQVWLGTYGNGLLSVADKGFAIYGVESEGAQATKIKDIFEDQAHNIWVAASDGLFKLDRSQVQAFGNKYTLDGRIPLEAAQKFTTADGLPSDNVTIVTQDEKGAIWIGTDRNGVARMLKGQQSFEPIPISDLPLSNMINAISPMENGDVWIATQDGAFFFSDEKPDPDFYSTQNGLAHNNIYDIFPDTKGRIWFATHSNRISVYENSSFSSITVTDTGEVTNVNSITEDMDGNIWLGAYGTGMYKYDGEEFSRIGVDKGLISNYCYQILVDKKNNIWVTHRDGFSRFITKSETVVPYLNKQLFGLEKNQISSAMVDHEGNIWFGSPVGLVRHNWVSERSPTEAPYIMLTSLEIKGVENALTEGLELPYGTYRANFAFLGLTFLDQDQVVYQSRLLGREDEWSEVTSSTDATFQGLQDGTYTFQVRARGALGTWNENPAEFTFTVSKPFWKAWWFLLLVVMAIGGLTFGYVKYRVYRLNKEKAELEGKIRERTVELRDEKKKLEVANLELEKLSLVASETDNAVFIIDKKGKLEWINPGFTRLTGYSFEEIKSMQKGQNFLSLSSNSEIGQLIQEVVSTNTSIQYESRLPSKSGENIWVISTLTPILDEEGELRKIVIIDSNITDRKEAESEVRKINEKLEQLVQERTQELAEANQNLQIENVEHIKTAEQLKATNQELDSFVYRASHDLKGPLASLLGLVSIAKSELPDNAIAQRYLGLMERRGERLDNILVDLIEATQVKQTQVELKKVKPAVVITEVLDIVQYKNDNLNVEFKVDVQEDLEVISDRKLIRAILNNFIENSAKYKDPKKEKATSTTKVYLEEDEIVISVTDNGIGIPASAHANVFDMFFRGTNTVDGSGLGFYIVKQAVDKLGGRVDMESEEGVGTTFLAYLPNNPPGSETAE